MTPLIELLERIEKALYTPTSLDEIPQLLIDCRSQLSLQETVINNQNKRPVRLLRVLEYVGDREWIDATIERRGVKGTYNVGANRRIREAIIGETNELFLEDDNNV